MITDTPQIDWITLTSYDKSLWRSIRFDWQNFHSGEIRAFNAIAHKMKQKKDVISVRKSKVMQYDGQVIGGVFFGAGRQQDRDHFMIRVSGERANTFAALAARGVFDMTCTRIDVQATCEKPADYRSLRLRASLDEWYEDMGRKPATEYRSDKARFDTVYLGSRTSEKFLRVYQKSDDDGVLYLRYEMELKGRTANLAWANVAHRGVVVSAEILSGSMRKIPDHVSDLNCFRWLAEFDGESLKVGRVVREDNRTVAWLYTAVAPAVRKLLRDHEQRESAVEFVEMLMGMVYEGDGEDNE